MSKVKIKQYSNIVYSINKYLEAYPDDPDMVKLLNLIANKGGI